MHYKATGQELSEAFARAKTYFDSKKPTDRGSKAQGYNVYTIWAAMRFATGHNKRVLHCALGLLSQRLEGKSATQWLIDNGVPKSEVSGLAGMKAMRVWKSLWLEKLAEEFKNDTSEYEYDYPF